MECTRSNRSLMALPSEEPGEVRFDDEANRALPFASPGCDFSGVLGAALQWPVTPASIHGLSKPAHPLSQRVLRPLRLPGLGTGTAPHLDVRRDTAMISPVAPSKTERSGPHFVHAAQGHTPPPRIPVIFPRIAVDFKRPPGANAGIDFGTDPIELGKDAQGNQKYGLKVYDLLVHLGPKCNKPRWWLDSDCLGLLAHELTHLLGYLECYTNCLARHDDWASNQAVLDACSAQCKGWAGHNEPGESTAVRVQEIVRMIAGWLIDFLHFGPSPSPSVSAPIRPVRHDY